MWKQRVTPNVISGQAAGGSSTSSGPAGFFRSIFSIHHPMMGKPWETPNFDQKIGGSFGKSS